MKLNLTPRETLGAVFLGFIALYALFQARFIILGPQISISYPADGTTATSSVITVTGTARNTTFISLDDRPIFLDEHGNFSEKLVLPEGQSTIMMRARDRFGRETQTSTRIVLTQ